jgi:DNA invertase Pin-like site-specific DNA recombinase
MASFRSEGGVSCARKGTRIEGNSRWISSRGCRRRSRRPEHKGTDRTAGRPSARSARRAGDGGGSQRGRRSWPKIAVDHLARATGFKAMTVIDDDLGRSGSGAVERRGFERLVALACSDDIGAVYCIEASRPARNGRDWRHLIESCALAAALVIDHEGAYDPRVVNDRLLLGLKRTMSEYELSLMRQRGLAARDSKARRGEFQDMLPPGYCWAGAGRIGIDPDEHVQEAVRMVFATFRELGSARQVFLWLRAAEIEMPVVRGNIDIYKVVWKAPAHHTVIQILHNPLHAGAYAFGRRAQRTRIVDGRAHKVNASGTRNKIGWSCCEITTPATLTGGKMRPTRSSCWRTPI